MKVECKSGLVDCHNGNDIEKIILECATGLNEILIFEDEDYPYLAISVNGERAVVHYFSSEQCGPYQSVGNEIDGTTKLLAGGEMWFAPNRAVIPLLSAIECAKQFLMEKQLPSCIEWGEL